jgi:hypothetical protein
MTVLFMIPIHSSTGSGAAADAGIEPAARSTASSRAKQALAKLDGNGHLTSLL